MSRYTLEGTMDVLQDVTWPIPTDLVAVGLFVVVTDGLVLGDPTGFTSLRAAFALPAVLFVPGYLLVATLFPRRNAGGGRTGSVLVADPSNLSRTGFRRAFRTYDLTWGERLALSFGSSLVVVPLLGLGLAPVTGSLSEESVLIGHNVFVVVGIAAGTVRRNEIPEEDRFGLPFRRWNRVVRATVVDDRSRLDKAISALFLFSIVAAVGTFGFTVLAPQDGETYTGTTLLAENDNGRLVASGYPTEFTEGEGQQFVLRLDNHEESETTYTVVAEVQRPEGGTDTRTFEASETVLREQRQVASGDTWTYRHTVTPTLTGENVRLAYYVYRGDAPTDPSEKSAYRHLHLWISVSEATG